MLRRFLGAVARPTRGIAAAIRGRSKTFGAVTLGVFVLDLLLPSLVLSLVRKPWDYFSFNPWLKQLPEYLASSDVPLQRKLEFLPNLAVFWFSANDQHGFVEWGFAVDVSDLLRFVFTALVFGAYFALWFYRRDHLLQCGVGQTASRNGGVAGVLASTLGLSTGPCSVVGCGAPVLPIVGLVFTGLSSDTLRFFTQFSKIATTAVLVFMTAGVVYLGWRAGTQPDIHPPSES